MMTPSDYQLPVTTPSAHFTLAVKQPKMGKKTRHIFNALVAITLTTASSGVEARAEIPVNADAIVDSAGVNVHLRQTATVYNDFPLIQTLLKDLGVRHIRDGLMDTTWKPYYERHTALGKLGIKCLFVTSPTQSESLLSSWPDRVPGAFEGYEAPNEYDNSGDPNWQATLSAFIPRLWNAVKSNSTTANYPIVGPSLIRASDATTLAGMSPYLDYTNLHNYYGGRNPGTAGWGANGYGSILYNVREMTTMATNLPIYSTETGYYTDLSVTGSIPELIEGRYVPRALFENYMHGIKRMYLYELIDQGGSRGAEGSYGLARNDGSHKPAYSGLRNLLNLLADPGMPFEGENLDFSLLGDTTNVHHLLMQKRDGSYYLALWVEEPNFDVNTKVTTPSKRRAINFSSNRVFTSSAITSLGPNGAASTKQVTPGHEISVLVGDTVTILQLH